MLCRATTQIAGYADVERPVSLICKDGDAGRHAAMMARVTGSLDPRFRVCEEMGCGSRGDANHLTSSRGPLARSLPPDRARGHAPGSDPGGHIPWGKPGPIPLLLRA